MRGRYNIISAAAYNYAGYWFMWLLTTCQRSRQLQYSKSKYVFSVLPRSLGTPSVNSGGGGGGM